MSDENIKPALTPEEWAVKRAGWAEIEPPNRLWFNAGEYEVKDKDRHSLAALALYGQPFGFTHEDVKAMEWVYRRVIADWQHALTIEGAAAVERHYALAAKIAALLPPEATP